MKKNDSFITLVADDNEEIEVEVIDEIVVNEVSFLLVAETSEEEESDCFIIKKIFEDDENFSYEVCDEEEQERIFEMFEKKLSSDDIKFVNRR